MTHYFPLCSVCVFSIAKKKISRSSWNPPTAMTAPGYLVPFRGLIPAVSVICWGRHAALPDCYSVRAARGVRSVAAGRTAVSEGPSEDRPLKWGQTADWQHRWTPGCTRSSICPHTRQKHIHLLKWFLVSYSALKMDVPMICLKSGTVSMAGRAVTNISSRLQLRYHDVWLRNNSDHKPWVAVIPLPLEIQECSLCTMICNGN